MGDRYAFYRDCPSCGLKIECYYAESCGITDVTCHNCGTEYIIGLQFVLTEKPVKEIKDYAPEDLLKYQIETEGEEGEQGE